MADKKISELTNITGANLADADEFVVVDVSADQTKAVTLGELKEAFDTGTGFVRITGDTMTGDLSFGDNDKAIFGAGSDLQIYHDGSDSYIKDAGTGRLKIIGNDQVRLENTDGDAYLAAVANGSTFLYYAGSNKFSTTSTGIDVTGTVTADGLTLDAANSEAIIGSNASYQGKIKYNDGLGEFEFRNTYDTTFRGYAFYRGSTDKTSLRLDGNGDISFYEDTGTTPKFFWDASAESLGIGTSSPTEALEVDGKIYINTAAPVLRFTDTDTGVDHLLAANSTVGNFAISVDENSEGTDPKFLVKVQDNSFFEVNEDGRIRFLNTSGEAMRIDSSGNLLVGKTSQDFGATGGFEFYGAGGDSLTIISRDDNHPLELRRNTTDGDIVKFLKDGTTVGSIGTLIGGLSIGSGDTGVRFSAGDTIQPFNPSTNLTRTSVIDLGTAGSRFKDLYLSGGVYLGGTGSANKLDDYEEGTWTPAASFAGDSDGITYIHREGVYTKVGRLVTAVIRVGLSSNGTATSGLFQISLPFTVSNAMSTTSVQGSAPVGFMSGFTGTHYDVQAVPWEGQNNFKVYYRTTSTSAASTATGPSEISNTFDCRITVQFMTDA